MHWLRILIIFAFASAWVSFPSVLSWGVCKSAKETGESLKCYQCASIEECKNPDDYITCDDAAVNWTLTELQKYFLDSKILIKPSERYMCFAASATRLDDKEYETRGCMYYNDARDEKPFLKYWFDFRYFLRYVRSYKWVVYWYSYKTYNWVRKTYTKAASYSKKVHRHWEQHNRTYWNLTHFIKSNCFQCADSYCNQDVSPYGGRRRFQRQFRSNNHWNCFEFETRRKAEFYKKCGQREIYGFCKNDWNWPKQTYHPAYTPTTRAGYTIKGPIFTE